MRLVKESVRYCTTPHVRRLPLVLRLRFVACAHLVVTMVLLSTVTTATMEWRNRRETREG